MTEILKDFYFNKGFKTVGLNKFIKAVQNEHKEISKEDIKNFYNQQEEPEIFQHQMNKKKYYKNKKKKIEDETTNKIIAFPNSYQIDLIYMQKNYGEGYFLLLIEINQRKAYAYVLKNKTMKEIISKYETFLKDINYNIVAVTGDDDFNKGDFIYLNENSAIKYYHVIAKEEHMTKTGNKLAIIDRAVRTIKGMFEKFYFDEGNKKNWKNDLQKIIGLYNNTEHSEIKDEPENITEDDKMVIFQNNLESKQKQKKPSYNIGDRVRYEIGKHQKEDRFKKEGEKYSSIHIIESKKGNRYKLKTLNDYVLERTFKYDELIPTKKK